MYISIQYFIIDIKLKIQTDYIGVDLSVYKIYNY